MLWPIQIHGIVLNVEQQDDGHPIFDIADFGYSSSGNGSSGSGSSSNANSGVQQVKKGLRDINNMMQNQ